MNVRCFGLLRMTASYCYGMSTLTLKKLCSHKSVVHTHMYPFGLFFCFFFQYLVTMFLCHLSLLVFVCFISVWPLDWPHSWGQGWCHSSWHPRIWHSSSTASSLNHCLVEISMNMGLLTKLFILSILCQFKSWESKNDHPYCVLTIQIPRNVVSDEQIVLGPWPSKSLSIFLRKEKRLPKYRIIRWLHSLIQSWTSTSKATSQSLISI